MADFTSDFLIQEIVLAPIVILTLAAMAYILTKKYFLPLLNALVSSGDARWKTIFDEQQPFKQVSFLAPTIFIYFGLQYIPDFATYVTRILNCYIAINITLMLNAVINTFLEIYNLYPISKERPIKSYAQMGGIFIYIVGGIIAICQLLDKDFWMFVSGIGALTAIIVLVFRDTILSFIAGVQILSNNLIRKNDWIEVPSFGADGAVIDVALHVIKVQNWDKTVVTIPTYKVIENGFKNWRGMYDSGGRRIKRSLLIDQTSVSFMSPEKLSALCEAPQINKYMGDFIDSANKNAHEGESELWEMTNLGVFRQYVEKYLRMHPRINPNLTFIIRLLDPTPYGIPLELYIFTKDTEWAKYEHVQSEVFEHFMAIMPIFGLNIYQRPSSQAVEGESRIEMGRKVSDKQSRKLA